MTFGHSEAKKACTVSSSRYANCMQNNKWGFPIVLTGWKAAVAFGQETGRLGLCGRELWSALLGEGGDHQLAGAGRPLQRIERGGLCKSKQSLSSILQFVWAATVLKSNIETRERRNQVMRTNWGKLRLVLKMSLETPHCIQLTCLRMWMYVFLCLDSLSWQGTGSSPQNYER